MFYISSQQLGMLPHLPLSAYMSQWTGLASVQVMACRLVVAKLLSKTIMEYCLVDP